MFSCKYWEILKNILNYFEEHCGRLLLDFKNLSLSFSFSLFSFEAQLFITRISRIIEKATLCMSYYDMTAKYEFKVINKYSHCTKKWSFRLRISSHLLRIWSHLLKKSLMENFIFCAVSSISLFHLNNIWLALVFMFIPVKKRRNSPSKLKDFVFKLYEAHKHQFDSQCLDDVITRFFISKTFFLAQPLHCLTF